MIDKHRPLRLTIADLIDQKVGVRFTNLKALQGQMHLPDLNMLVADYINYNKSILQGNLEAVLEEITS